MKTSSNLQDYEVRDGIWVALVSIYAKMGWLFCGVALVSIAGIIALPVLIPAYIAAIVYKKKWTASAKPRALKAFQQAGFQVTTELKPGSANFLIDEKQKAFAFWDINAKDFTPGIAMFSEVTGVDWSKEGDLYTKSAIGVDVKSKIGRTDFSIKLNRFEHPVFTFRVNNQHAAEVLMQQFSMLANLETR